MQDTPSPENGQNSGIAAKTSLENLSKDELINKYKGLLGIAKKAKQAKDEVTEENRLLKEKLGATETQKEADKKALMTMKEMLEQFTDHKLQLSTQLSELQQKSRNDDGLLAQLRIENESLHRQLNSMTAENESLLKDIDAMENQLQKVNLIGIEQKKHLELLEIEVNRLKESESHSASLKQRLSVSFEENKALKEQENTTRRTLDELSEKYKSVKEINREQRLKFNSLKERFVDVLRKLKKLKECKRVLLETQHEYADAISKWQNEIIHASRQLCAQMQALKTENEELRKKSVLLSGNMERSDEAKTLNLELIARQLKELDNLACVAIEEQSQQRYLVEQLQADSKSVTVNEKPRLDEMTEALETQKLENKCLVQELHDLKTKIENTEQVLKVLQAENFELKNQEKMEEETVGKHDWSNMKIALETRIEDLSKALEDKLHTVAELEANLKLKKEECECLEVNLKKTQSETEQIVSLKHQRESRIDDLMRTLDEKTNAIAQLQDTIGTNKNIQTEYDAVKLELLNCRESYEELQGRCVLKEREHADLLDEMRELNEALKARGDVISRQEEKQKDLIAELKFNATKLKQFEESLQKKETDIATKNVELQQLTKEVEQSQVLVRDLEADCARNDDQINVLTAELQNLKQSGINSDAQSDVLSVTSISRADELNRLREADDSLEERYTKLRALAVKLKKKLQEQTTYANELEQKLSGEESLRHELQELKTKIGALGEQRQLNEILAAENKKLKSSRKQANVLNLEIEAAEKSLADVSAKLNAKSNEVNELTLMVQTKEATIVQLRKELNILEAAKTAECEHAKELKTQVDRLQSQIKDAVHSKQTALDNSKDLEHEQERLKRTIEDLSLQLAESAKKHATELVDLSTKNTELSAKLQEMDTTLASTQSTLRSTERAMEDTRLEYTEYKVKAQAVLRKNQSKDTTRERELEEEILKLRNETQQLETHAQHFEHKVEESEKQIEVLREDNDSMQRRNVELHNLIEELRLQNEALVQEQRAVQQSQQDSLRQQRQHIESLDICHKEQLQTLELSYQRQIEQLKADLSKAARQPPIIGAVAKLPPVAPDANKAGDLLLMEREDAEGSEEAHLTTTLNALAAKRKISNASSSTKRSMHEFMPLDELLNAPLNALNSETLLNTNSMIIDNSQNANLSLDSVEHLELQIAKERLLKEESRVRHLTALLAENEQDLAKLTQMNDMLKEELRRQERSVEREQHMHNSEYLKNVIIKFLTLSSVDEKTRLVPVLNTILKLSRAETDLLNCAAKGQKVSESNTRGWSNFLPSWGGGNN